MSIRTHGPEPCASANSATRPGEVAQRTNALVCTATWSSARTRAPTIGRAAGDDPSATLTAPSDAATEPSDRGHNERCDAHRRCWTLEPTDDTWPRMRALQHFERRLEGAVEGFFARA